MLHDHRPVPGIGCSFRDTNQTKALRCREAEGVGSCFKLVLLNQLPMNQLLPMHTAVNLLVKGQES